MNAAMAARGRGVERGPSIRRCLAAGLVVALLLTAFPGRAQTVCGAWSDIVKRLAAVHRERQAAAGIASNGGLVEIYVSRKGGWTILFTRPGGMTCLMAVGENWQRVEQPFKEQRGDGT